VRGLLYGRLAAVRVACEGHATRRAFGGRTWLTLRAIDVLVRFADPRVRAEAERGPRLVREPIVVAFDSAIRHEEGAS